MQGSIGRRKASLSPNARQRGRGKLTLREPLSPSGLAELVGPPGTPSTPDIGALTKVSRINIVLLGYCNINIVKEFKGKLNA